jgi:hypothetical protein
MTIKTPRLLAVGCFLILSSAGFAQDSSPPVHLKGIVSLGSKQFALLHYQEPGKPARDLMLDPDSSEYNVALDAIDAATGTVKVRVRGRPFDVAFTSGAPVGTLVAAGTADSTTQPLTKPAAIRLEEVPLKTVLLIYQMFTTRTVVRPSALPEVKVSLYSSSPITAGDTARAIEQALALEGVSLQVEGEKFAVANRSGAADYLTADVRDAAAELAKNLPDAAPGAPDVIAPGEINFPSTDLSQVLMIFADLANRTLIHIDTLPMPPIVFKTQSMMSKSELILGLTSVLAANGISVVPAREKFMLALITPARREAAELAAGKNPLPLAPEQQEGPPRDMNLRRTGLDTVLTLYQQLSGRTIEADPNIRRPGFTLSSLKPLTPSESLTALDLLLGVNGLIVVPNADGITARLEQIGVRKKSQ